jgi:hypothetical protein
MRSLSVQQFRVPLVAVLATAELVGLVCFYRWSVFHSANDGKRFSAILILSCLTTGLVVAYLWSDWLEKRNIHYFEIVVILALGFGANPRFTHGDLLRSVLNGSIASIFLIAILPRLFRLPGAPQRRVQRKSDAPRANQSGENQIELSPTHKRVGRYVGILLLWVLVLDWLWNRARSPVPLWLKSISILPAVWLMLQPVILRLQEQSASRGLHLADSDEKQSGGRA